MRLSYPTHAAHESLRIYQKDRPSWFVPAPDPAFLSTPKFWLVLHSRTGDLPTAPTLGTHDSVFLSLDRAERFALLRVAAGDTTIRIISVKCGCGSCLADLRVRFASGHFACYVQTSEEITL